MAPHQPTSRGVQSVPYHEVLRDNNDRPILNPLTAYKPLTRAVQIIPAFNLITDVLAIDVEMQSVRIAGREKELKRIGRLTIVNIYGQVVYDVFVYYDEIEGYTKRLTPARFGFGVYKPDLKIRNGARPVAEVEGNVRKIVPGCILTGHAIHNDVKVFSKGVFDGVKGIRDTQLHEAYRVYGKAPKFEPKLAVLAEKVLGYGIQGSEHSSVEDAQATMSLYLREKEGIEAAQGSWAVTPESRWGGLGIQNEGKEVDDEEEWYEEEDEEVVEDEDVAENDANTEEVAPPPVSQAGMFWGGGVGTIKQALDSTSSGAVASWKKPALPTAPRAISMANANVVSLPTSVFAAPTPVLNKSGTFWRATPTAVKNRSPLFISTNSSITKPTSQNTVAESVREASASSSSDGVRSKSSSISTDTEATSLSSTSTPHPEITETENITKSNTEKITHAIPTQENTSASWARIAAKSNANATPSVAAPGAGVKKAGKLVLKHGKGV